MNLSFAHASHGARRDLEKLKVVVLKGKQQTLREKVVADENRDFVFPICVDGCEPAACVRIINHIIMHKSCRVQNFHERCAAVAFLVHSSAQLGTEENEYRPDSLSFGFDDVLHHEINQTNLRTNGFGEHIIKTLKMILDRRGNLFKTQTMLDELWLLETFDVRLIPAPHACVCHATQRRRCRC